MASHGSGAGSSSQERRRAMFVPGMPRTLRVDEASLLARCGVMVPPDTPLPSGWHMSLGGLAVEPVPTVGTPAMSRVIGAFWEGLLPEERSKPRYALDSLRWLEILAEEHAARIQHYDGRYPTSRNNIDERYAFWEGRTFPDVMVACRAQLGLEEGCYL